MRTNEPGVTTRGVFLGGVGAALVAGAGGAKGAGLITMGETVTQAALFASLPAPRSGQWTRLIMGSGALYQKADRARFGSRSRRQHAAVLRVRSRGPGWFVQSESLHKAYLRSNHYGSLLDTYPLISNIGRAANLVFRYGDVTSSSSSSANDKTLRLLDLPALFDPRPMTIVSVGPERRHQASRLVDTTRVVGEYESAPSAHHKLRRVELWHAPSFPFGLVRYRATFDGLEPYSFGDDYKSDLPLSLDRVRAVTKDDQYGNIPAS